MEKRFDQRRESRDQATEGCAKQQQPRREEQYHEINRSEEEIFRLMVQSVCDTKQDS